jgi:hypothetical protein
MMKKVLLIFALVVALASLAGVSKGWKWNSLKSGTPTMHVAEGWTWDGTTDGWTWDGSSPE